MLKRILVGCFLFVGVAAAFPSTSTPAIAEVRIKLAHVNAADPKASNAAAMAVAFKASLEASTAGGLAVDIFPSSQLGKERELMEAIKLGTIQAIIISEGTTVNFFRPLEVFGVPYLFPSMDIAWKVVDGPFGQQLYEEFRKQNGVRIIGSSPPGGFRNFGTNKVIRSVADLKGMRIRTMEHPIHQAMVSGLGASPMPVAYGELYDALRSGIVDGLELPFAQILNTKLYEVIKNVVVDQHLFNQEMLFVNDRWFGSLKPEEQKAVLSAGREAQIAGRGLALITNATGAQDLTAAGIKIYFPTATELDAFRKAAQPPALEALKKRVDPKWVDGILSATLEASK